MSLKSKINNTELCIWYSYLRVCRIIRFIIRSRVLWPLPAPLIASVHALRFTCVSELNGAGSVSPSSGNSDMCQNVTTSKPIIRNQQTEIWIPDRCYIWTRPFNTSWHVLLYCTLWA